MDYVRIYDFKSIQKRIGSYILTITIDNVYAKRYVGYSNNLFSRLNNHEYNNNIIFTDLFITDDVELAQSIERILINLIKPALNIHKPILYDDDKNIIEQILQDEEIKNCLYNVKIGERFLKCLHVNEKQYDLTRVTNKNTSWTSLAGNSIKVTIPKIIAEKANINYNNLLFFQIDNDNNIIIRKIEGGF